MISGTSVIWSKYGPAYLPIITKILQRIQEKYSLIFLKYYFHIWESDNFIFRKLWKACPTCFRNTCSDIIFSRNIFLYLNLNVFSKNNSSLLLYFEKTIQNSFLQMHQLLFDCKRFKKLEIFENIKISFELKNIFLRFKKSSGKKSNKFLILDFSEISMIKF